MTSGHTYHDAAGHHDAGHHGHVHHGPRTLPLALDAPAVVKAWRTRCAIVFVVALLLSTPFFFLYGGRTHLLRAYLLGFMICFSFAGGGLVMLMLQYVSGGKWGLLLRRPLEAMSRTIFYVALMFIPIWALMKHLYQWALFDTPELRATAVATGHMTREESLTAAAKHAMFSPASYTIQSIAIFAILGLLTFLLNKWSVERDADPLAGTQASFDKWRVRFENLSGPGIFVYVVCLTAAALSWVMSLDVTWYSSIWGLKFLVGQGYAVLALGIFSVIVLSKYEPIKTLLRTTEQHDLGKFAFAFVMLNIYLTFAEFLIIWSGNVPDEIPWYLARIHGGWWYICSLDFVCHWLVPFCMLLSRNLKRDKKRLKYIAIFMIFARMVDMFWIIEPNFRDSRANLHAGGGMLAYLTVPVAVIALWGIFYTTELMRRPLVNVNDPHLEEILEPEHAH